MLSVMISEENEEEEDDDDEDEEERRADFSKKKYIHNAIKNSAHKLLSQFHCLCWLPIIQTVINRKVA